MKWFLFIFSSVVIAIVVMLVSLSIASRKQPELGLQQGLLMPCGSESMENCVCSEFPSVAMHIEPFLYSVPETAAWSRLKAAIIETGGEVVTEESGYLQAIYKTPLLRYIDDVEFRLDTTNQRIHVRSASRVGKSDMGTNRQRVEKIRKTFNRLESE